MGEISAATYVDVASQVCGETNGTCVAQTMIRSKVGLSLDPRKPLSA
jgi:hypothetical protein